MPELFWELIRFLQEPAQTSFGNVTDIMYLQTADSRHSNLPENYKKRRTRWSDH